MAPDTVGAALAQLELELTRRVLALRRRHNAELAPLYADLAALNALRLPAGVALADDRLRALSAPGELVTGVTSLPPRRDERGQRAQRS